MKQFNMADIWKYTQENWRWSTIKTPLSFSTDCTDTSWVLGVETGVCKGNGNANRRGLVWFAAIKSADGKVFRSAGSWWLTPRTSLMNPSWTSSTASSCTLSSEQKYKGSQNTCSTCIISVLTTTKWCAFKVLSCYSSTIRCTDCSNSFPYCVIWMFYQHAHK